MTKSEESALAWAEGRRLDAWGSREPEPHAVTLAALCRRQAAVIEAARECVGFRPDGTATFQPECNGSAQDLVAALAAHDAAQEAHGS